MRIQQGQERLSSRPVFFATHVPCSVTPVGALEPIQFLLGLVNVRATVG